MKIEIPKSKPTYQNKNVFQLFDKIKIVFKKILLKPETESELIMLSSEISQ